MVDSRLKLSMALDPSCQRIDGANEHDVNITLPKQENPKLKHKNLRAYQNLIIQVAVKIKIPWYHYGV